jgi:hypothetical protein
MVSDEFISLALINLPHWVRDSVLYGISRELRKQKLEIAEILEATDKVIRFKLRPTDGRKLSATYILEIRKPELPIFPIEWGIYWIFEKRR